MVEIFIYAQKEVYHINMSSRRGWNTPHAGPSKSTLKGQGIGPYYGQPPGDSCAGNTNTRVDQLSHDAGSSRRGWNTQHAGPSKSTPKGQGIGPYYGQPPGDSCAGNANTRVDQFSHGVGNTGRHYNRYGDWKVTMNKSKNQSGGNAVEQWGTQHSTSNAPGQPNAVQKRGMSINSATGKPSGTVWQTQTVDATRITGSGKLNDQQNNRCLDAPSTVVARPLQHGRQWGARGGPAPFNLGQHSGEDYGSDVGGRQNQNDSDEDDDDDDWEDVDDECMSDDFDANGSVKSWGSGKKKEKFKSLFAELDKLTVEQLNDSSRPWHCPACQTITKGLQALMTHAKTKCANIKLHRELAGLLDEELNRRGTRVIHGGEAFHKWRGLLETVYDQEIVWPPMIVVMNTKLEKDEHEKWSGMGNQELHDYFSSYKVFKVCHSYGPEGHRGMSLLIFESSAVGYLEAERLDKHFAAQGTHRRAWDENPVLFLPGGKRQLYGYMACRAVLDDFNKHSGGKQKVKYDMRSYQEMVVVPIKQMNEDNQQLISFKNKYLEEQKRIEVLKKSVVFFSHRMKKTIEENHIVRERTKTKHDQKHEAIDLLEGLFKEHTNLFQESLEQKEREDFEAPSMEDKEKF